MKIAIIGTVGVPANYGGFETLAENLVKYHAAASLADELTVYCSGKSYPERSPTYLSARLRYVPLNANGAQSIPYDIWSLFSAVWHRSDVILLLGVSGAIALPLVRLLYSARIVTNIDGIEWRREKWQGMAKRFLRFSEKMAVRFSHEVIADNAAIAAYVKDAYDADCHVIAYGGDHAVAVDAVSVGELFGQKDKFSVQEGVGLVKRGHPSTSSGRTVSTRDSIEPTGLPDSYAFSVCRIEPENNVHMVLESFAGQGSLVMVGNWDNSVYGRALRARYAGVAHLHLLDPVYDLGKLKSLRAGAALYVHGHSAGGTNPSLVEAMHFGLPVLAFDCDFNRATTEGKAWYFRDADELGRLAGMRDGVALRANGVAMLEIAQRRYTWDVVAKQYFDLIRAA